jgi:hypothetical protein
LRPPWSCQVRISPVIAAGARLGPARARIAGGEHPFAPAVMTGPAAPAPRSQRPGGRELRSYTDLDWSRLATGATGRYAEFRQRLNGYADRLAPRIDRSPSDLISLNTARRFT